VASRSLLSVEDIGELLDGAGVFLSKVVNIRACSYLTAENVPSLWPHASTSNDIISQAVRRRALHLCMS
jgi:hypothetical protein